jgi:SAM-dependent methyltransferase
MFLSLKQALRYKADGLGLAGSLLKHSLVPIRLLQSVLPDRGVVLDLGSGDGVLGNLVAAALPGVSIRGIDKDAKKVRIAADNAPRNARFEHGDVAALDTAPAQGAILNDVLHHHPRDTQLALLRKTASLLEPGAPLILKEVDAADRADVAWTRFWDSRLYPDDPLVFRRADDWTEALASAGFTVQRIHRVSHPWPASRTVFVCRRDPA